MTEDEKQKLNYVYDTLKKMEFSATVPLQIHNSLKKNLGLDTGSIELAGTGDYGTQDVNVTTTPTQVTVPAQPSGTLKLKINGVLYELLKK